MHVIATAGHVDHGKSTLVRALTGMEPDRWEAEQRRGMTIDLGFAWTPLPSGEQVAFVDVPGHERFVSNMLAGAGPAPAVMFVVAADEGWKPQSAEHLAAIDAFGVRHGLLVITRADLADPEPARREAIRRLAATSLGRPGRPGGSDRSEGIETVAVSAISGAGMPELAAALDRLVARLPRPDPAAGVRLWLDRVFAIKGAGTVVTGTLQAGTVRIGDELTPSPAGRPLRIRGVQSLGAPASEVSGVARVALNLRGVSTRELGRGMALIQPGRWTMTSAIDVALTPRGGEPAPAELTLPAQLTLHIGTARTAARARMLGDRIARLSLAQPLPLNVGDRVLLRDPGAAATPGSGQPIFGATVLDVVPPPLRFRGAAAAAKRELTSWPDPPTAADLLRRHRLLRASAVRAMGLTEHPAPVAGEWLADPEHWRRLRDLLTETVAAHARQDPMAPGLPVDAARDRLGLPDRRLVDALVTTLPDLRLDGGYVTRGAGPAHPAGPALPAGAALPAGLPARVAESLRTLLSDLEREPFAAPDSQRLAALGLDVRAAAVAERAGLVLRLPGNVIVAADADAQAARALAELPQPFTAAEARQALRTSRRVVIPLLERLDRKGITRRLADDRRILRSADSARQ